ncbi:MAG: hypothetical protein V9G23_02890 [Giesbergeria sp.]
MSVSMQHRAAAAGWYTVAALLAVIALAAIAWLGNVLLPMTAAGWVVLLLPLPCAALMGFLFGTQPHDVPVRMGRAALRGAGVMLLAFLLTTLLIALMAGGENAPPLAERVGFILLVGGFSVGWLALLLGAVTGWRLARRSLSVHAASSTPAAFQPEP